MLEKLGYSIIFQIKSAIVALNTHFHTAMATPPGAPVTPGHVFYPRWHTGLLPHGLAKSPGGEESVARLKYTGNFRLLLHSVVAQPSELQSRRWSMCEVFS